MTAQTLEQCAKRVFWGSHDHSCSRAGKLFEKGQWWCRQHAPSSVKKRDDVRKVKWVAARKIKEENWARRQQEKTAYEHTYAKGINPEALAALVDACNLIDWRALAAKVELDGDNTAARLLAVGDALVKSRLPSEEPGP